MKALIILVMFITFISCSTFKKDKNNFTGENSGDISSVSIDSDHKGSDSGTIDGLSSLFFKYNSSALSQDGKDILEKNIEWINSHLEVKKIELEGHCDSMGSEAYNIGLGRRRAESVRNFLIEKDINRSKISIISYGEEHLLSELDHVKNRRVNFVPIY